ncbi:Transcription initiation factor TFIID subunit 5 [Vitis vinifera]|uniref:Transcription initiation factor TFIID subunit 5 n=1 Tax=Vitis vinifera TaxID=29760 RepID=A0A438FZE5_VITVI|nr:Transcription initiation factor TFIID subunit 5 [Vitis vinifera]
MATSNNKMNASWKDFELALDMESVFVIFCTYVFTWLKFVLCSMSCFECFIQYLYTVLWILWQKAYSRSFREDHEMMHLRDLQKLEGVLSPSHLEEMEFAHFSEAKQSQHKDMPVSPGQPASISDDAEVVTLIGSSQDDANQINQKEIHWG